MIGFLIEFEHEKGGQREAFGEAKGMPNRAQNDPKMT